VICVDSIFESICFFCKIALSIIFIVVAYINFNNWIMFSIGDFGWLSITAFNNLNFFTITLLLCSVYFIWQEDIYWFTKARLGVLLK